MIDTNLYVVTAIFNPMQFQSRAKLYAAFATHMANTGAKLFTVEAAFGDHPHEVTSPSNPMHLQLRTSQVLWHKERMLNLGINRVVALFPDAKYIAWIDADVTFSNPNWVFDATHALMHYSVIQPFATAVDLGPRGEHRFSTASIINKFLTSRGYHQDPPANHPYMFHGHPGLAWAATRDALDALGGLLDVCPAGSSDSIMAGSLLGNAEQYQPVVPAPGLQKYFTRWATRSHKLIRGNVGYSDGVCLHHWHGNHQTRGYEKRWQIMAFHQFDPDDDIKLDAQGLYQWSGRNSRLEDDIRLSLSERNEDSVDIL